MDARAANDRIAEKAQQLRFVSRVPMLCECSQPACRAIVMIPIGEYRQIREDPGHFLIAPGHCLDDTELHEETQNYSVRRLRRRNGEGNGDRRSA
jgi:hypothetical protein